jgi:uncharacterized protein (DUF433 family)
MKASNPEHRHPAAQAGAIHASHGSAHGKSHSHEEGKAAQLPSALLEVVESDPAVLHGTPVFGGTMVPVEILLEYRRAGAPLYEFLLDFPTVRRAHAKRVWAWMEKNSVADVRKTLSHAKAHHAAAHSPEHKRGGK